jgi:hypothetical protein
MKVRDSSNGSEDGWRKVWGKEAAAINPLAAVNTGRNSLIEESIRTNDWTKYNNFQAKQHPAWYDKVNGEMKQNKLYYGNIIDVQNRSLKEAIQTGDKTEIDKRKAHLDDLINDFKNAPGEVPHVIAFVTDPALASSHGIEKPSNEWYNSPYNNSMAQSQGRFEQINWYENPYFADNPGEMEFAMDAVKEFRPDIANIAATINRGAYERSIGSTATSSKTVVEYNPIEETIKPEPIIQLAEVQESVASKAIFEQAAQIVSQFSTTSLVEQLFKQNEQAQRSTTHDFLMDRLNRHAEQRKSQVV